MATIEVMSELLSNKIAAGEVVERPASVVKELVENAIDAQATKIEVHLEDAGIRSIRVIDNGQGMDYSNAQKAFERHATSKLSNEYDLFHISTLGFRGEALASIAAVSKVHMVTSTGEEGAEIVIEGGHLQSLSYAPLRKGTDFTVSQLFYNTPARLKHMKTIQTELGQIIDLLNRFAFSHPAIAFVLTNDGKVMHQSAGMNDLRRTIASVYSLQVAEKMVSFASENEDFKIEGWISKPEMTRARKNYMTIIVNGRYIQSYAIQQAITDAMHTFLPIHRYPIVVMHITSDPQLTDVNVHPAKKIIRMSKEDVLLEMIRTTIRTKMQQVVTIPQATVPKKTVTPSIQSTLWAPLKDVEEQPSPVTMPQRQEVEEAREDSYELPINDWLIDRDLDSNQSEQILEQPEALASSQEKAQFPELEVVGQIHGTYIVAQNETGFYLIDQHAAQERIKYEFFKEKLGNIAEVEMTQLLIPLVFHYAQQEMKVIESK
ncbi:MAG TPA: DNA mismatch repair endonuclease MutL, partial [Savagea sp.]